MIRVTKFSFIALLFLLINVSAAAVEFDSLVVVLKGEPYHLEIADTRLRQQRGLMFRHSLDDNEGMLFIYPAEGNHRIWMKNTRIPLAVFWLDGSARIINKQLLTPCRILNCPVYQAAKPSQYVLELHPSALSKFQLGEVLAELESLKFSQ